MSSRDAILKDYEDANHAFMVGSALEQPSEELLRFMNGLSNQNNTNEGTKNRDLIRALMIQQVLQQRHISLLERSTQRVSMLVVVLTVVSTLASVAQVYAAFK